MNIKRREKLHRLTNFWYDYVGSDHHKDKDCHWYIDADFAYGKEPVFTAFHFGYVAGDLRGPDRRTYDEAEEDLVDLIEAAIEKEKDWARGVLEDKSAYGEDQIKSADKILKVDL